MRAVNLYETSALRKHEIKLHYQESGDSSDVAADKMVKDMRYRIASEDYKDAMTEMTALSAALQVLYRMKERGYGA